MSGLPGFVAGIGKFIEAAMLTQWVVLILIPILVTFGAIALKFTSRKVRQKDPADLLLGFDLGVTACLTLMVSGIVFVNSTTPPADRQHYVEGLFFVLMFFILLLILAAVFMHYKGWEASTPPKPAGWAQLVINAVGLFLLISAFVLTGGKFR